ncbi:MAG TPA: ABC transporter ATP-binding protein, partial [Thermoanaerobaculia bacterium]|nr:ABC transporter ATP-binding protein [Thermoanaerobaculia bacterium]
MLRIREPVFSSARRTRRTERTEPRRADPYVIWRHARRLLWERRGRIAAGFLLMAVGRAAALILPFSTKFIVDEVILDRQTALLTPIALAIALAAVLQAVTSFGLTRILGIAAHQTITETRRRVHRKIMRLPIRYFEQEKSGALLARIMHDAEGLRTLIGAGFVQLVIAMVSALVGLAVLFYLNWQLTLVTLGALILFGALMVGAFRVMRPMYRQVREITSQISGRLT